MKLYEMEGFLRGKCIPGDLKVNETNAEYLVRKFSEAEERCAALSADNEKAMEAMKQANEAVKLAQSKYSKLASENAALRSALNNILQPDAAVLERNHRVRALDAMETPATNVFLAEVRAQGVEMFADKYRSQLTALPTTPENIFDAAHVRLRYQIFDADEFAAQLRKGVQS